MACAARAFERCHGVRKTRKTGSCAASAGSGIASAAGTLAGGLVTFGAVIDTVIISRNTAKCSYNMQRKSSLYESLQHSLPRVVTAHIEQLVCDSLLWNNLL